MRGYLGEWCRMITVYKTSDYNEILAKRDVLENVGMYVLMSDAHESSATVDTAFLPRYNLKVKEEDAKQAVILMHPDIAPEELFSPPRPDAAPATSSLLKSIMPFVIGKIVIGLAIAAYFIFWF